MKIILSEVLQDYREDICCICGKECNPHYRFGYYSEEKDLMGNALIDEELQCCKDCKAKLRGMFR